MTRALDRSVERPAINFHMIPHIAEAERDWFLEQVTRTTPKGGGAPTLHNILHIVDHGESDAAWAFVEDVRRRMSL